MSPIPSRIVIASRGSRLALAQVEIVRSLIASAHPTIEVALVEVTTRGDRDLRPFAEIGSKGLFVKEVERTLLDGRADVAVHSAKDLTADLAEGCVLACVPARAPVHDVVVGGSGDTGYERLGSLPPGARVGTSSVRRRALLAEARPDLEAEDLRGNLDTRLAKVAAGNLDAAIVAAAGIERLGDPLPTGPLDPDRWTPPPAQGALALETVAARSDLLALLEPLGDPTAWAEVTCERAYSARLEGGCSVPLGCLARVDGSRLVVSGYLGAPDGGHSLRDRISGPVRDAAALGIELAEAILAAGGDELLADLEGMSLTTPSPP
ncbi:MAG: hydroxymethylbilane synthase [Actinomycetota bacterium]